MTTDISMEKETGNKVVITLQDHGLPMIEEYSKGICIGRASYTHEDVVGSLFHSLEYTAIQTPLLPTNALKYLEGPMQSTCVLEIPASNRTAYYHEAVIKNVPYPRIIMAFKLKKNDNKFRIEKVFVAALLSDDLTDEGMKIYRYPYTNVYGDHDYSVCWGSQRLPELDRISQLSTIPDLFFNTPNSDSYYHSANNSKMPYRELVDSLKGKKKLFPDEYLRPTEYTLGEWIKAMDSK